MNRNVCKWFSPIRVSLIVNLANKNYPSINQWRLLIKEAVLSAIRQEILYPISWLIDVKMIATLLKYIGLRLCYISLVANKKLYNTISTIWLCDEIGRHDRFKICCWKACRFESDHSYCHDRRGVILYVSSPTVTTPIAVGLKTTLLRVIIIDSLNGKEKCLKWLSIQTFDNDRKSNTNNNNL